MSSRDDDATIRSYNDPLFEIDPDDITLEAMEQRLELTLGIGIGGPPTCEEFTCTTYAPPPAQ